MPKIINNNLTSPAVNKSFRSRQDNKNMKKEFIFPLIVGLILGALVMVFWQFNARLSVQMAKVSQLEQATAQNSKAVTDIVSFIQQATNAQGANQPAGAAQ